MLRGVVLTWQQITFCSFKQLLTPSGNNANLDIVGLNLARLLTLASNNMTVHSFLHMQSICKNIGKLIKLGRLLGPDVGVSWAVFGPQARDFNLLHRIIGNMGVCNNCLIMKCELLHLEFLLSAACSCV